MYPTRPVGALFKLVIAASWLLVLLSAKSWAGGIGATTLTFHESWADKLICLGSNHDFCVTYPSGRFTITAVISSNSFDAAIDPSQFTESTTFDITLGNYSFSTVLGADPEYVAGVSKKARFLVAGNRCGANPFDCPTKVYETITVSMTSEKVALSVSAATGTDSRGNGFENSIDAENFYGDETGMITNTISFEVGLGSLTVSSDILPVAGRVATRTVTDKSETQHTLSNVRIEGILPKSDLGL